jgi:peptidoglycan/LPS O-acetylase OafA/YrhL
MVALVAVVRVMQKKNRKLLWVVISAVAAIVGIVVFIWTQNMSNPITMVDWWTLLHVVLAGAGIVATVLAIKGNAEKQSSQKRV